MAIQPVGQPVYESRLEAASSVGLASDERRTWLVNHASWGAILAGVAVALLVQMMCDLLGTGLGLASLHVEPGTMTEPKVAGLLMAAAIWLVVSGVLASLLGGIVAGRLSGSARHSTAAWHGFVAWCVTILLALLLLGGLAGGPGGAALDALVGPLAGTRQGAFGYASPVGQAPMEAVLGVQGEVNALLNPNDPAAAQASIARYVQAVEDGRATDAQAARQAAIEALSRTANISPQEAQARLDQTEQRLTQSARQAAQQAVAARREAGRGALFAFAGLLLSGIAAIVGGGLGTPRRLVP